MIQLPVAQAGVLVLFEPKQVQGPRMSERGMWVCPISIGSCQPMPLSATTDSMGRASVRLRFGTVAGAAWIYVVAESAGLVDSVHYTVRPVAAAGFAFGNRDSSAYIGGSYATAPYLVDRLGNATTGSFTATATGPTATITSGGVFTARQIGRGSAIFRSGSFTDTAWISVPPMGTISAWDAGVNGPSRIVTFNLDGSAIAPRIVAGNPDLEQYSDWLPNGDVVYDGPNDLLYAVDAAGNARRMSGPASTATYEGLPSVGHDGSIVYTARVPGDGFTSVWRVGAVGATPTRIPLPPVPGNTWKAALSPDLSPGRVHR